MKKMILGCILIVVTVLLVACGPTQPPACDPETQKIQVSAPNESGNVVVSVPVGYGVTAEDIVFTDVKGEADYGGNFTLVSERTDDCQTHFEFRFNPIGNRYEVYIHAEWQENEPYAVLGEAILQQ